MDDNFNASLQNPKALISVDSNGVVYVVYPDDTDQIVYRKKQNGTWSDRVTIDGSVSLPHDATIDAEGLLNVLYSKWPSGNYKDATLKLYVGGEYNIIEGPANFQSGSLVIGDDSVTRISYFYDDDTNEVLKYAVKDGNGWNIETVANCSWIPSYAWGTTRLALDSNEVPHIVYCYFSNGDFRYANRVGGSWTSETIDSAPSTDQHTSIAVDSNDRIHIVYQKSDFEAGKSLLKYATVSAGEWRIETITDFNLPTAYLSIVCDEQNRPHICFRSSSMEEVKYAVAEICGDSGHPYPAGDTDKNCLVDLFDMSRVGQHWLDTGCGLPDYCSGADLNESSVVDYNDLDMLGETWLECSLTDCY